MRARRLRARDLLRPPTERLDGAARSPPFLRGALGTSVGAERRPEMHGFGEKEEPEPLPQGTCVGADAVLRWNADGAAAGVPERKLAKTPEALSLFGIAKAPTRVPLVDRSDTLAKLLSALFSAGWSSKQIRGFFGKFSLDDLYG